MILIIITLLSISFTDVKANTFPMIYGCFCEGGIITTTVKSGSEVTINNKKIHVFQDGRFIFAFGRKFKESVQIQINGESKIFQIKKKEYKIENIRGLPTNKVEPSPSELKKIIHEQNLIKNSKKMDEKKKLFNNRFILPSKGRLSGVYGSQRILNSKPRKPHAGIDIAAREGNPVVAPSDGKIKLVVKDMFFTGNTIIMDHGLGLISIFAHLNEIFAEEGDYVTQGSKIGSIGMTGRATGPHLHWGVYLENTSVDPIALLEFELF